MKTKRNSPIFLLFTLIICVLTQNASADGPAVLWEKTLGGNSDDYGYSVQETSDGGYIIAGQTYSFGAGGSDVYLIKTDPNGNSQWQKTFGGSNYDYGESVQQTSDGGYIIAGTTDSFGAGYFDVYLIKTDSNGNLLWQKTFGGYNYDFGSSAQETSDGGFVIAGETYSFGAGKSDVYLIKTDPNGDSRWQKTFGGSDYDQGYSVQETSNGGFIIAGTTYSLGAGYGDVYLIKTDPNGNPLWQKTFGGSNSEYSSSVQETSDGGFIIAGGTSSFGAGEYDAYLIKTDPNGNLIWQKTFGGSDYDWGDSVQETADGGFIIVGETSSFGDPNGDVYLLKTDPNGNLLWQKTFGGSIRDYGSSVQQTTDGGFIIAGGSNYESGSSAQQTSDDRDIIEVTTKSFGDPNGDVYLIKLCGLSDLNCDGLVDFYDFAIFANQWLQQPTIPSADIAPAVPDNFVDILDLAAFVEYWLQGTTP